MARALRVRETLQREDAYAVGEAGAVGCLGKGLAAPVRGEATLATELDEDSRSRVDRHPTGQRQRALTPAQGCSSKVHGDQR